MVLQHLATDTEFRILFLDVMTVDTNTMTAAMMGVVGGGSIQYFLYHIDVFMEM